MFNKEITSYKENLMLYSLTGSLVLIGVSWAIMFGTIILKHLKTKE